MRGALAAPPAFTIVQRPVRASRSAIVGLTGMQRIVLSAVSYFTGRSFQLCGSVEEAKNHLSTSA